MPSYIHAWGFQPEEDFALSGSEITVVKGEVGLKYGNNPAALAPGQPAQAYSKLETIYVRTSTFAPEALTSWGFIQFLGETDSVDGTQVTFLEARVWDGAQALYWDGAGWSAAGPDQFNTLTDFNANLSSYTGTSLALEVRLRTTDGQFTPVLREVCLKWTGRAVSFLRDWVVDTLLRSMKDAIRPVTRCVMNHQGGDIIALSDHPPDAEWNYTDVVAVYDDESDPDRTTNLLVSYDATEGLVTLSSSVAAGVPLFVELRYAPQIAITTSSDYLEGGKSPAILVTMVNPTWQGKSIGARGPAVLDVTTAVPGGTVFPNPIPMIDVDIALATVAPTSHDLIVLNEALTSWLESHPTLRSRALDQVVKMYPGNVLDWNTAQDDVKDPRLAVATLRLANVPFIADESSGAADGSASKKVGAVDVGDPSAPGIGYGVSKVTIGSQIIGTGGSSSLTIPEE